MFSLLYHLLGLLRPINCDQKINRLETSSFQQRDDFEVIIRSEQVPHDKKRNEKRKTEQDY